MKLMEWKENCISGYNIRRDKAGQGAKGGLREEDGLCVFVKEMHFPAVRDGSQQWETMEF
jgi:hypothetical protein